jgi:pilus retraction protein PilT
MSDDGPGLLSLLSAMERIEASDLFITEGKPPAARVHGVVRPMKTQPTGRAELDELLRLALTGEARAGFEATGDCDAGLSHEGRRFRLNISRQQGRLGVVARLVPPGDLSFRELGLPGAVARFADAARGIVLVTGATGSGKSTTLAALIHHINTHRRAHIVTIEDPVEFVHADIKSRVTQREIGSDTAGFHSALRGIVRQSPDVILIGEMRDHETIEVALQAALTGHLVLCSLHTINATQTLQRMLSYFPEHLRGQVAMDLSLSLVGVCSQRLVPRTDEGRVVAVEVLTNGPAVQKLLRDQRVEELQDLMRGSKDPGLVTFNRSLLRLFRDGDIEYDVGLAYSSNPEEYALHAEGMATGVATFRSEGGEAGELDMKALLDIAMDRGASDLHLGVGRPPILRIDGDLVEVGRRRLTDGDMRVLLYSILSGRQRSIYELEREIDFALGLETGRRFRVNAYFQRGRMAAALRAISDHIPDPDELGIPETLMDLGTRPQGLLLVVGPTGSGKSTTLACLVDRINTTRSCRIITIEDPIEYVHEGKMATVDQREVYEDTSSFSAALKYILRQDPDVILVGEMRDYETISAAITAAETGHLVLATLHSNDAVQAVDRMIDTFPSHQQSQARSQIAGGLLGVISQRLLPRKDGKGRAAVFEIMVANSAIRAQIRDDKLHQAHSTIEAGKSDGMVTMDRALKDAYEADLIAWEDAVRYLRNPKAIPAPGSAPPPEEPPPGGRGKWGKW